MCMECHYYYCPSGCPGERVEELEEASECACCGENFSNEEDFRLLDGNVLCVDCIRGMRLYELLELCGVPNEEALCDILGFELPKYSMYEEG